MKNNNLIHIFALLLFISPACNKHKATVDGFVRDIGTQKPLGGLLVSIIKTEGSSEYGAGHTTTDATGYFKCDFEIQSGFSYQLRCEDPASNTIWYWVDVNQKANPLGVRNSGENLTKDKTQHKDMWMGRFAEYDSIVFTATTPFFKTDSIHIHFQDRYKFALDFTDFIFNSVGLDSIYQFSYKAQYPFIGDAYTLVQISGIKQGQPLIFLDSILIPTSQKIVPKIIIP